MEKRDYYEVLGVSKNASVDEIKSAYKRLAKAHHPDVSSDSKAKEKFQEILEAYTILSDPQKRSNYDQFGHATEGFSGYRGGFEGFGAGGGIDFDFSELFENIGGFGEFGFEDFGFGSLNKKARHRRKGENLRADVTLSFEEAAFGIAKKIELERNESCSACTGTGAKNSELKTCSGCNGRGFITRSQRMPFGVFSTQSMCSKCGGSGKSAMDVCAHCRGKGEIKTRKTIEVIIPAGIETGMHLRVENLGNAGKNGGEPGDLFVVVFVESHDFFKRDHGDLFCEVPISFAQAALGTDLHVQTLKGHSNIKVPDGTQTGTIFRLSQKGIKDIHSEKTGDQFVKVIVETPKKLSKEEKKLFEELEKIHTKKRGRKGFLDGIGL